ncbi:FIP1[V]-like protein [Camellia lanceoleosa]|uniref:FIP1[V]-like protein n=1 Tax=Camellia lanceoleosa TaxID=1840588 RepID=A0ACC0G3R1_9ERIC|nr:FIP1[V]-like protein [Camellia lanceoleosa]
MEDEDDEFGQLYTDVLPWLSSSSPNPFSSSSVISPFIVHPPPTNHATLVSDHQTPLKLHFRGSKNTNFDHKKNILELDYEYKENFESGVFSSERLSDGLSLVEPIGDLEVKNGDIEENHEFEMEFVEKEKETEAVGVLNVQRLDSGLDVIIGDLMDSSGEGSFAGPAETTMGIDIDIDNLGFSSIFTELMSCTSCIKNVVENAENEEDGIRGFRNANDCGIGVNNKDEGSNNESQENEVDMRGFNNANDRGIGVNNNEDSDKEDGLNIIFTDDDSSGWVGVNENGVGMDKKVKGREDLFVVVDKDNGHCNEGVDEDEVADGERKRTGEEAKGRTELGNAIGLTIGFPDNSCHFECMRPAAASIPGGASVGPGGSSHHIPSFVNVRPAADHIRVDWQPTPIKSSNSVHHMSSLGRLARGNNSSAHVICKRLNSMLPSNMTVFDINIDNLQEKRWRHPGADLSDFFNFGLDELKWKDYCGQMEQLCLDSMRSKIIIYESRGSEQNNDRGTPLELATATSSHDLLAENPFRRTDATKEKLPSEGMETAPELSPIPIGQAIQVDFGSGERLPSIYTRHPRTRDSEAIIEIAVDGTDAERENFKKDVAPLDTRVHKNIHGGGIWPFPLDSGRQVSFDFQHCAGIHRTPHKERKLQSNEKTDGMEEGEIASDKECPSETLKNESLILSVKIPRPRSQFIQPINNITDGDDFRIIQNNEYSRARSGSNWDKHLILWSDDYGKDEGHKRNLQEIEENHVNFYLPARKNLKIHNWSDDEKILSPKHGRSDYTLTDQDECLDYTHARRKGEEYMRRKYDCEVKVSHGYKSRKGYLPGKRARIRRKGEGSQRSHQTTSSPTKRYHVNSRSYCSEKVRVESSSEQTRMMPPTADSIDCCDLGQLKSSSVAFTKHHEKESLKQCYFLRKQREDDNSTTNEQDLKRGRSKWERWTSYDED